MAWPLWRQYLLSLALVGLAVLARGAMQPLLGDRSPFLVVFGALLILVLTVRAGPFLAGAALGGVGTWMMVMPADARSAGSNRTVDLLLFAAAVAVAGLAAWLSARQHDRLRLTLQRAREQREALRVTLASIGDAVITTDNKGRITFANAVAESLTGWSRAEATGLSLERVFHIVSEDDRAPVDSPVAKVLREGHVVGLANHTLLIRKDGSDVAIDDSAAPIQDGDGTVTGVVLVFRDAAQRRQDERRLERSERELASFFDTASLGLLWIGPDGRVLRANRAQLQLLGLKDTDYLGHPFADFHVGEDAMAEFLAPLMRGEKLPERAAQLRHADGSVRDVQLGCDAWFEDGKFQHARCFVQDMTEKLRAEHARRESEDRFRTTADNAPVLIWMADADGRYEWFNRPWREFTGRSMAQEVGDGWAAGLHPDDAERCLKTYRSALEARQPFTMDYRLRRHDGEYRWMLDTGAPRLDPGGRFEGFIGSCLDITARKHAEAALARSEARFRGLADANLIGVGFGDTHGGTTYLNDEMLRMMGRSRADFEAGGLRWFECLAPEYAHLHDGWRQQLLAEGRVGGYERAFLRPDGGRTPYLGAAALLEKGSDFHVRIALDLTRLKEAEAGRQALLAQLRQADRRKDEFLATLAHELRNPLAPAVHSLDIMRRAGDDPRLVERSRVTIERQLQHMVRLIDDLLDVSRITRDRLELRRTLIELQAVLESALEVGRPALAAARQALHVSCPEQPLWLHADPVRLVQVFSNLLGNAGKYSPAGSPISVTVRATADRHAEIVFIDRGIGIEPEMLQHIFDMFVQGRQLPGGSHGGLGIGLTLARRLVELHDGELSVSSGGRGLGSTFVVRLPLATAGSPGLAGSATASDDVIAIQGRAGSGEDRGASGEHHREADSGPDTQQDDLAMPRRAAAATGTTAATGTAALSRRILVVDDNLDAATTLAMLLELGGHQTCTAHDGVQALATAERFRPDVVLLDIGLPLLDGHEVARRLRAQAWAHGLVLVALTGWGQEDDRRASQDAGFDAHLVKPVEHDTLLRLLGQLLEPASPAA